MVRFRNSALDHKHEKWHFTTVEAMRCRFRALRLGTAGTGPSRRVAPNTCPSLSHHLGDRSAGRARGRRPLALQGRRASSMRRRAM